jgi:RecA/RadA recombinase
MLRQKASWIIKGLIPNANLGVIYGASGSGKSFFAFDLFAAVSRALTMKQLKQATEDGHVAEPSKWRGLKTLGARVCWVAAEGQEDMRKRAQGYCHKQGIPPEALHMEFIDETPNFLELADVKSVIKQMKKRGRFDIVVIDTLAQVMPGGNENSGEDMGKVLGYCKEITRLTGAMVVLIHHSGKDESRGARGWSGLRAACDFEFEIIRAGIDRVATVTKMKGGADGEEFGFRLETIVVGQDDDGDDEVTCVVEFTDSSRASVTTSQDPKGDNQKLVMQKAKNMIELAGTGVTFSEIVSVVIPAYPRGDETKRDQRRGNVSRDLKELIKAGRLKQDDVGVVSLP